jgi:ribonucleoside-diphosphate reductase alpha chain
VRNALLTSVAPTGTISLFAGNVSSGIEPVFAASYTRRVLQPDGSRTEEEVVDRAVAVWREAHEGLPPAYVDAQTLAPMDHVAMQAAAQEWVDASISKTVNVPEDIAFEAFQEVYLAAWDQGCKGCTTYRPNAVTGSVLSAAPAPAAAPTPAPPVDAPQERPGELEGATYKIKWPGSPHALYITVNDVVEDGPNGPSRRPFEVFVNSKNMEHYAWTVALTRMISAVFRRGGAVAFVVDELQAVFDPRGGAWMGGRYVPSILAAIGDVIERHMVRTGFLPGAEAGPAPTMAGDGSEPGTGPEAAPALGASCPNCGEPALHMADGCLTCASCGYSQCG